MNPARRAPPEPERLVGQCRRVMAYYLSHPGWYTLAELVRGIGGTSESGMSARLRQLAHPKGRFKWLKARRKRARNLWEYRMSPPGRAVQLEIL